VRQPAQRLLDALHQALKQLKIGRDRIEPDLHRGIL